MHNQEHESTKIEDQESKEKEIVNQEEVVEELLLNFRKMAKDAKFLALKELAIKQDELLK